MVKKKPSCQCRRRQRLGFNVWVRKISWNGKWQPTPVFLPGKFHGQRSLVGYSPWGAKVHGVTKSRTRRSTHTQCVYGMAFRAQLKGCIKVDICPCYICEICSMGVGLTHETGAASKVVVCMKSESEVTQLCPTLCDPHGPYRTRLLCPWNSPGKNTGVGSYSLLQGIFPTQGSNPGLLHCRQTLYRLSHSTSKI